MKNNLENQLKDAFDGFEPEVDPSLWSKISSQLPSAPAPVQPPSPPTGLLSSLGTTGTWIAGTAALLIAATGLYLALNSDNQKFVNTPPATEVETVTNSTNQTPDQQVADIPADQAKQQTIGSAHSPVIEEPNVETPVAAPTSDKSETATPAESTPAHTAVQAAPVTAPRPEIPPVEKTNEVKAGDNNPDAVPFRLITNVQGGFAPLSVTILTNQPGTQAEFDFGDGASGRGQSVTHIYKSPGLYQLEGGAADQQYSQEIEVLEALPTAFSPNGDGANDYYVIDNGDIREIEIKIYNRAGRQAFSAKGTSISWNGTYSDGRPAETGTYFYDIFVTSSRGGLYKQKGTLTLFR